MMFDNGPVIQLEPESDVGMTILPATGEHGRSSYCNTTFVTAGGCDRRELFDQSAAAACMLR
ncbi:MAG: hypothetical protein EPN59_17005 [Paraburkholderia sp.]|nr:MAG: hypothetical protein EPN59_17005 [Paraburkholderia sp.]